MSKRAAAAWAVILGSCLSLHIACGAEPQGSQKQELLDLTGGRRVKVVWDQGTERDIHVKYYDSSEDKIVELPLKKESGPTDMEERSVPLLTADGRYVLTSVGAKEKRKVMMFDTEKKTVTALTEGLCNYLISLWTDPKTQKTWAYVNGTKDKGEAWNVPGGGPIYRFPLDNPGARELFWDRTSSHFYLMFAADGTRACFEPSWGNIGQLTLAFTPDGKVDQDKTVYKAYGGGCFPSMAPDNSYRLFRLEGDHRSVSMSDADNANVRKVVTTDAAFGNGATWLTRWSTHPRYLTCMAPDSDHAMIWIGRFDEGCTRIEKWVRVSETNSPKCWLSHAWIEPGK